jgi:hypothetical protein
MTSNHHPSPTSLNQPSIDTIIHLLHLLTLLPYRYGIWHFAGLQKLILQHERELQDLQIANKLEKAKLQKEHDEEEQAMLNPNCPLLKAAHGHGGKKHHHAYSDRVHKHKGGKSFKHETGEERLHMLHAVDIQAGESADEFRIRRMKEAIALKKDKGKQVDSRPSTVGEDKGEEGDFYQYVFCSILLPSFLVCDVSVSLLSMYCSLLAFSDKTEV